MKLTSPKTVDVNPFKCPNNQMLCARHPKSQAPDPNLWWRVTLQSEYARKAAEAGTAHAA